MKKKKEANIIRGGGVPMKSLNIPATISPPKEEGNIDH